MSLTEPGAELVVVVGNPRPWSRTRQAAEVTAAAITPYLGPLASATEVLDLAGVAEPLATGDQRGLAASIELISRASVVVVATPVYKGSFTGVLKLFLDHLPEHALREVVAVPVTLAAAASHRLLADLHLRPVLGELGASVPTPSLTLVEAELTSLGTHVARWVDRHAALVAVCARTRCSQLEEVT